MFPVIYIDVKKNILKISYVKTCTQELFFCTYRIFIFFQILIPKIFFFVRYLFSLFVHFFLFIPPFLCYHIIIFFYIV
jgi:hypothetical protein